MVLLSFLLVLAAAVTLVIGLLNGGLGLIYVSIGCSLLAGIVLAIAVLRSRPRGEPAAGGPEPLPSRAPERLPADDEEEEEEERARVPAGVGARGGAAEFPIADYDDLKVSDILPLLPELEPEELEMVREHEAAGKNRSRILGRIDMLSAEHDWDRTDDWDDRTRGVEEEATVVRPALDDELDEMDHDEGDEDDFGAGPFPIADYDELTVGEILPLLPELDADELELVRQHEERGANRAMILNRIDRLSGGEDEEEPEEEEPEEEEPEFAEERPAPRRAPAKKTAKKTTKAAKKSTKKSAAKKSTAKKSTAKKTAKKAAKAKKR